MAFITAPTLATSPNQPTRGQAVLVARTLKPTAPIVMTRPPLTAPSAGGLSNLSNGTPV